jgi:hypothetical protein
MTQRGRICGWVGKGVTWNSLYSFIRETNLDWKHVHGHTLKIDCFRAHVLKTEVLFHFSDSTRHTR